MEKISLKIAIIDLNNGEENQGVAGIVEILNQFETDNNIIIKYKIYDLRAKGELPNLNYNAYISTGGPGSPLDIADVDWENELFKLLDNIELFNKENQANKKYVFLICHSFQLACKKYNIGEITARKSNVFGVFPITLTKDGLNAQLFQGLPNPFFAIDSRDWQVIKPKQNVIKAKNIKLLAIEKERKNKALERCLMAVQFTNEIYGSQFHPEGNPVGVKNYLESPQKKETIIEKHGEAVYQQMLNSVINPDHISKTQKTILPNFLKFLLPKS